MSSGNGVRRCEGCSGPLAGRQRRFCSDRCRSRVRRSGRSNAVVNAVEDGQGGRVVSLPTPDTPDAVPGECRAGLDEWLAEVEDVPAALVAHCRMLADQVDADPDNSPLHGRYSTALGQLAAHVEIVSEAERVRLESALSEIAHAGDVEQYRARRYRQAVDAGEDPSRWSKLVPVACVKGEHCWHTWQAGAQVCLDCDSDVATV